MDFDFEGAQNVFNRMAIQVRRIQFGIKAQLAFLEDLYVLVNDGIPPSRALEMMAQITTGISREVALSIAQKISEGQPLAEGMRDWFSMNVIEIIRVGEEGGALTQTMKSAIETVSQRSGLFTAFFAAVTYPLMVITIACAIIIYLNNSVFVQFRMIKPIEEWPAAGKQLISIAMLIQSWWWLAIVAVVTIIIVFRSLMNNYTGEFRALLDQIPPFSLYRKLMGARVMESLGLLVENGVVLRQAIKVMQYQANPYLISHLVVMEHQLGAGKANVADVLSTGLIEEADILRLRVMAEVRGFEHGLVRMGVRGREQSTQTIRIISRLVGSTLLIVGGILVIIIVRGIYLTGMSMGSM